MIPPIADPEESTLGVFTSTSTSRTAARLAGSLVAAFAASMSPVRSRLLARSLALRSISSKKDAREPGVPVESTVITRFLGYRSKVFRESIGEVITVANVHSKKGAQAIIAATAFNKLRETALKRAESAQTGGAYWRQTVLDELRAAGMAEEEAKGIAQIVAPYGSIQFDKFVDRSATQSQLTSKTIAAMEMGWKAKEEGALPVPSLSKTL